MIDLQLTEDGDLIVAPNGDLKMCYGDEELAQEILFRLKTTIGDWTLSPNIGASLEQFIGQPNITATHNLINQAVTKAITANSLTLAPSVTVMPIGTNDVFILVEFLSIENNDRVIQVQSGLDLRKGLVFSRISSRIQ